jgi:hypothetical protein
VCCATLRADLDDDAVNGHVVVKLADTIQQFLLCGRVGEVDVLDGDAHLGSTLHLHPDVRGRVCTVAHLHVTRLSRLRVAVRWGMSGSR